MSSYKKIANNHSHRKSNRRSHRRLRKKHRKSVKSVWNPPKSITKRRSMLSRYGPKCFLDPNKDHPRYPVCNRVGNETYDGLLSALISARQSGHDDIVKIAKRRLKKYKNIRHDFLDILKNM